MSSKHAHEFAVKRPEPKKASRPNWDKIGGPTFIKLLWKLLSLNLILAGKLFKPDLTLRSKALIQKEHPIKFHQVKFSN